MNYYLDFEKIPTTSDTFVLEILKLSPLGPKPCFPSTYSSIHFMPEMFLCEMTRECIIKEESHFPTHRYVPSLCIYIQQILLLKISFYDFYNHIGVHAHSNFWSQNLCIKLNSKKIGK